MKKYNYQSGKNGEEIARTYLIKKGYKHIESNFRTRFGEIDLIFSKDNKLIFVEVKLKIGDQFGTPEEMINKRKVLQVTKTAQMYLIQNQKIENSHKGYQIDAVCIVQNEDGSIARISHYENVGSEL
ncbi:hypothetical protein A3D00_04765 [Candidatus Woesebacteria bacterium RIFCSPHIGHO2_02_FULL_38_9]|uniref:UPF0102 protein A2627_04125 n=1 Tax=Candidatus Woesebacteria bacterium RIFCSPHIGHO2_01_FULL_39_28 TaxID=1802496 RepID=A0A1F7YJM9_9BACT|nr:MAG: hypothetical protein A2627_04125 [Candidatus Woesebacteria bacterium RIFCSPHIGHO2_01_FULL_39_28]OGM34918.1 MAG: hypothetical protein A3D00_04765 [Candidatus Woesebacteria bacterium RIFCSPHIGHO2_02_FULL_38_9]OGM58683.1 MAG: hypothetical protein A3A50_02780 [Candidatus Woesebacteria bacterium RIFCSPLOWO2_01_FULL_38_20]